MIFNALPLAGAYLIELDKKVDDRGFFARAFCEQEFSQHGLATHVCQANISLSVRKGTLRGMHYQLAPKAETKIVRCLRGAFYDVIVDIRVDSSSFGQSFGIDLTAENRRMLYVPKGFAHGFVTLADNTEALYFVDEFYSPEHERGFRYDDPKFGVKWPAEPTIISDKDKAFPQFDPVWHLGQH